MPSSVIFVQPRTAISSLQQERLQRDKTLGVHALTMSALLFRIVCLLAFAGVSDGAAKVKRVKAGKSYKTHDAVHIVVNKVG
jgi:hypothetical protein